LPQTLPGVVEKDCVGEKDCIDWLQAEGF